MRPLKIGSRVRITRKDIPKVIRIRKNPTGTITHIDGAYISVRPTGEHWEIELYPNEIQVL